MNASSLELGQWSRRRWIYNFFAVFALQVALVWLLGERLPRPAPVRPEGTTVHMAVDPWAAQKITDWPVLQDPTLFALPNEHGFSADAWLAFVPMDYELKDWSGPPRWLGLEQVRLGEAFANMVTTSSWPHLSIADKPMPSSLISDFNVLNVPVPTASICSIEGDLAGRPLLEVLNLPSWPRADLLTNSIIELLVNEEGLTFSARLLDTSGFSDADDYALKTATQARFAPLPEQQRLQAMPGGFTSGRMIFRWHAILPAVTNLPSAILPPK